MSHNSMRCLANLIWFRYPPPHPHPFENLKNCSYRDLSTLLLRLQLKWMDVIQLVRRRASLQLSLYEPASGLWLKQSGDSEWVAWCCRRKQFCGVRWRVISSIDVMPTGSWEMASQWKVSCRFLYGGLFTPFIKNDYTSLKSSLDKWMILCWASIK